MGREIKRVPVDFDHPVGETWPGYLMPESLRGEPCTACHQRGATPAHQWLVACCQMISMLGDDLYAQQQGRPMHPYFDHFYSTARGTRPTPDIAELIEGLTGRELHPLSSNGWTIANKVIAAAGLPEKWGWCTACDGEGRTDKYEGQSAEAEAWVPTEPPAGDGWQVWETVSEGSPISPVFADREGLVDWLCSPAYTWGVSTPMSREQAARFVESAWAPSLVATSAGVVAGEQWVGGDSR